MALRRGKWEEHEGEKETSEELGKRHLFPPAETCMSVMRADARLLNRRGGGGQGGKKKGTDTLENEWHTCVPYNEVVKADESK
jgi:hypothetical protein